MTDHTARVRRPHDAASRRSSRGVKQVVHSSAGTSAPDSSRIAVCSWFTPASASKLSVSSSQRTWK
ncbi:MAG TPA: hypothetical protein VKA65_17465 [Acidimicrobiales bacterium]|nr:hypothetical protein [Acidimicrobiales bacterium]